MGTDSDRLLQVEKRLERLENAVFHEKPKKPKAKAKTKIKKPKAKTEALESSIVAQVGSTNIQDLVMISLKLHEGQTRDELRTTLQGWGKACGQWFEGGNIHRLAKKDTIQVSKNKGSKTVFSLTQQGDKRAKALIKKIKSKQVKA